METTFNENIATVLGQKVGYSSKYNPSILVREPRLRNRETYGIDENNLKFVGFDNWNCYEISFLLDNGYPLSGMIRLVYPANNKFLVESKSLKLYLNSFNMEKFGITPMEATARVVDTIKADLSKLLETDVQATFFSFPQTSRAIWKDYKEIDSLINVTDLKIEKYNESPDVLRGVSDGNMEFLQIAIPFLRSNCKITGQPDWGTAFINYAGVYKIELDSLAKYIISFRNENHFHEEVCEMIYTRLFERFLPNKLMVACCYTRRGGIDINPVRATSIDLIPHEFTRSDFFINKLLQQ